MGGKERAMGREVVCLLQDKYRRSLMICMFSKLQERYAHPVESYVQPDGKDNTTGILVHVWKYVDPRCNQRVRDGSRALPQGHFRPIILVVRLSRLVNVAS